MQLPDLVSRQLTKALADRQAYLRCLIALANAIRAGSELPTHEGHPCVRVSDLESMSGATPFTLTLKEVSLAKEGAAEGDPEERFVQIIVGVPAQNGKVLAPQTPRLIVPGGA